MKNILQLRIESDLLGIVEIVHNTTLVGQFKTNSLIDFEIETQPGRNTLQIKSITNQIFNVQFVTMFDLGKEKLVYFGQVFDQNSVYQSQQVVPGATWSLEYQDPIFVWLHQTLGHGWLLPK
jgi:hypothetical protein